MRVKDSEFERLNEELEKLRREVDTLKNLPSINIDSKENIPVACRNCSCHPSNGGDGICNCTLGMIQVTC